MLETEWAIYDTSTGRLNELRGTDETITWPSNLVVTREDGSKLRIVSLEALNTTAINWFDIRGDMPLVIAVQQSSTIDGIVSYNFGPETTCLGTTPGAPSAPNGAGGGGGGGFAHAGGAGGRGDAVGPEPGGAGGTGGPAMEGLVPLRVGCAGATGGLGDGVGHGYAAGSLQISVRGTLRFRGSAELNGGGGHAGKVGGGGGGGGGSGGALLLEAGTLAFEADVLLCANGGIGGQGGDATTAGPSGSGGHCSANAPAVVDQSQGGVGGAGGYASTSATAGAPGDPASLAGGGGGGGSAGRIGLRAKTGVTVPAGMLVTPPATILP